MQGFGDSFLIRLDRINLFDCIYKANKSGQNSKWIYIGVYPIRKRKSCMNMVTLVHPIISSCLQLGHTRTWMGSFPLGFLVFSPMTGFLQAGQVTGTGLSQAVKSHLG